MTGAAPLWGVYYTTLLRLDEKKSGSGTGKLKSLPPDVVKSLDELYGKAPAEIEAYFFGDGVGYALEEAASSPAGAAETLDNYYTCAIGMIGRAERREMGPERRAEYESLRRRMEERYGALTQDFAGRP